MKINEYNYNGESYNLTFEYAEDRFVLRLLNNNSFPKDIGHFVSWIISPTSRCDGRCNYCFADHYTLGDSPLKVNEFEKLAQAAARDGLLRCDFSGGEPFLRDDLEDIISVMVPHIGVVVTTAARNLKIERIKRISEYIPFIQISLDGHTDEMNSPRHTKVKKLINKIIGIIDLGIKVRILTVVHKFNYNKLAEFASILNELGVWEWKIINAVPYGKAQSWNGLLVDSEKAIVMNQLKETSIKHQVVGFSRKKQRVCIVLEDNLHMLIDRDGKETDMGRIDLNSPFELLSKLPTEDSIVHLNYYLSTHSSGEVIRYES